MLPISVEVEFRRPVFTASPVIHKSWRIGRILAPSSLFPPHDATSGAGCAPRASRSGISVHGCPEEALSKAMNPKRLTSMSRLAAFGAARLPSTVTHWTLTAPRLVSKWSARLAPAAELETIGGRVQFLWICLRQPILAPAHFVTLTGTLCGALAFRYHKWCSCDQKNEKRRRLEVLEHETAADTRKPR